MSNAIKISDAGKIAKKEGFDMVMVIGMNVDGSGHITTYGKTKDLCKLAGTIGQTDVANFIWGTTQVLTQRIKTFKK